jgi:heat-inducible transcriptional repressor
MMDDRLNTLLRYIIAEYVATSEPVSSQALVDNYDLDVSPATVRNWFAELDEHGMTTQPHTAGGRVPTEAGFKHYVSTQVAQRPAGKKVRERLEEAATANREQRLRAVARELAELSGLAAVVGGTDSYFTGLSHLLHQTEFQNHERMLRLTETLEHLDDTLNDVQPEASNLPQVYVGKDSPFGPMSGAVFAQTRYGLVGIVGPLRMDYQTALSNLLSALKALE